MNRRSVLTGTGLALSGTLAGCLSNGTTDKLPPTSDKGDGESDGHRCPPRGNLAITFVPEVPDDDPILDAEEEQFTSGEYLAIALSEARDKYGKLDEKKRNESKRLVEFRGEEVANHSAEIVNKIEYGETTYVEYKNVTYAMIYTEMVC